MHYGRAVRILHWCTDQTVTAALTQMDLTAAQGHIIGFLACCAGGPPCPRDIERVFHLSHPTVSGLLDRLEKKGFIATAPDSGDRRVRRIELLPKGRECFQMIRGVIDETEARMVQGFAPEEEAAFAALLERAIANMSKDDKEESHS